MTSSWLAWATYQDPVSKQQWEQQYKNTCCELHQNSIILQERLECLQILESLGANPHEYQEIQQLYFDIFPMLYCLSVPPPSNSEDSFILTSQLRILGISSITKFTLNSPGLFFAKKKKKISLVF